MNVDDGKYSFSLKQRKQNYLEILYMDKVSYALGLGIGQQLSQMGADDLNVDDFAQSIKDVQKGNELKV